MLYDANEWMISYMCLSQDVEDLKESQNLDSRCFWEPNMHDIICHIVDQVSDCQKHWRIENFPVTPEEK